VDNTAELEKWKAHARKWEQRAKENSDAATRLAELEQANMTELEKAKKAAEDAAKRAEEAEAARKAAEVAALRTRIGAEKGLPAALVARLQGDDEDAIAADADELLKSIPKSYPDLGQGHGTPDGKLTPEAAAKLSLAEYEQAVKEGRI
jgi:ATPase subunit of ABC transporter with duplicated ATPase domains